MDPPLGRVTFKLCLYSHTRQYNQYLQGCAPHYLSELQYAIQLHDQNRRRLRSAAGVDDLIILKTSVRMVKNELGVNTKAVWRF